ncbi:unnamed protein product [Nesidiocoris tenuis]|uniref:Uncharacterized protein n=1 Tax=Nesidiocoris tenuis TaxID=355587 RepID=A0A6H5GZ26_9HEMI|nr:unnamed protein product [Nesidiocoris tenuis]
MFLGGIPKNGINFMAPAGLHRARWMAKGIYAIKVYMFRGEFKMTKKEEVAITELCMFVVSIYVYHWFQAPSCRFAPRNDLKLLKDLKAYNKVNEAIAEVALKKFSGHLWYLSEVLVAFAFFDENVPLETKTKMVQALENEGQEDTLRRITIDSRDSKYNMLKNSILNCCHILILAASEPAQTRWSTRVPKSFLISPKRFEFSLFRKQIVLVTVFSIGWKNGVPKSRDCDTTARNLLATVNYVTTGMRGDQQSGRPAELSSPRSSAVSSIPT